MSAQSMVRSSPLPLCPHAAAPIERRLLGAQSDACARIGTRAPRRPHVWDRPQFSDAAFALRRTSDWEISASEAMENAVNEELRRFHKYYVRSLSSLS